MREASVQQAMKAAILTSRTSVSVWAGATDTGSVTVTTSAAIHPARPLPTALLGAVLGFLVTLTSVGAGALGVVALLFLYPLLPTRQIVGADIAHAVPLTLVAGVGHAMLGTVNWSLLGALLIGSLPAIYLGAAFAHRMPEKVLRVILSIMLVGVGLRLIIN
ncbi:MAG TPA: sulfite exporter TauE/SafE family protein, partial [Burkholderiaceae bacterium]|nr:sulfite exporter TauE/SafE family protein [Burkholderiaceae bacterium]